MYCGEREYTTEYAAHPEYHGQLMHWYLIAGEQKSLCVTFSQWTEWTINNCHMGSSHPHLMPYNITSTQDAL